MKRNAELPVERDRAAGYSTRSFRRSAKSRPFGVVGIERPALNAAGIIDHGDLVGDPPIYEGDQTPFHSPSAGVFAAPAGPERSRSCGRLPPPATFAALPASFICICLIC